MNRYVQYIIEDIREAINEEEFSDSIGFSNENFLRYLNDAQHRLQARIQAQYPMVFLKQLDMDVTRGINTIDLPRDAYLGNKVIDAKFSTTNSNNYFQRLKPSWISRFKNTSEGRPYEYIRKNSQIVLYPTPSLGGIARITYVTRVPELALRSGQIESVTLDVDSNITSFQLNVISDAPNFNQLDRATRYSIVDEEGNIKASHVKLSINRVTGLVNIEAPLEEGEVIEANDYILANPYATTHSQFDVSIERYLLSYCSVKMLQQGGSNELGEEAQTLTSFENEIIATYADIQGDFILIPDIVQPENDWDF